MVEGRLLGLLHLRWPAPAPLLHRLPPLLRELHDGLRRSVGSNCSGTQPLLRARAASTAGCGCANGNSANRRVCCNYFRYGQCHQEIACSGPVTCRVVSCTPPYLSDSACTSTTCTDNANCDPLGGVRRQPPARNHEDLRGGARDANLGPQTVDPGPGPRRLRHHVGLGIGEPGDRCRKDGDRRLQRAARGPRRAPTRAPARSPSSSEG